jgi:APA family basic amino acid/polyamine antiporter
MTAPATPPPQPESAVARPELVRELSLLDTVLLIVGGIIGSGIFLTAGPIAAEVRRPVLFILIWAIGGGITLLACFAFAELGAMFPEAGGQYVYLREAYGELPAFLYGWMIFTVSAPGTIAALAVGFAEYLGALWPVLTAHAPIVRLGRLPLTRGDLVAMGAIALLTTTNIFGVRRGAMVQNIATWMKFAAAAVFIALGTAIGHGTWANFRRPIRGGQGSLVVSFGVALIAVFWAYDGWIYATWVGGEIKDARRNIPRALIAGVAIVAAVYVAINVTYLYALPMGAIARETTVAQAAAVALFSPAAARWLAAMIAISCFGAMSSAILAYARVFYAMAGDGLFFRKLADVHPRWHTPVVSLVVQGIWSGVLELSGTYDQLFTYAVFMLVISYIATVAALFVLRRTRPDAPRPYRCSGYPWAPIIYLIVGALWGINGVVGRPKETLGGLLIVLTGIPGYLYWRKAKS